MAALVFNGTISTDGATTTEVIATGNQIEGQIVGGPQGETGSQGPQGDPGVVQAVVAGTNVTVDSSDPANPVVSASGDVASVNGQTGTVVLDPDDLDDTSTTNKFATASELSDIASNTSARHTHSNKALLDTYTQTEADLADAVAKKHTAVDISGKQDILVSGTNIKTINSTSILGSGDIVISGGGGGGTWGSITGTLSSQTDLDSALTGKEDLANKDTDITLAANSDTKYPSQKAVKTYVDTNTDIPPSFTTPPKNSTSLVTSWQSGHGWSVTGTGSSSNLNDTTDYILGSQSASGTSNGAGAATNMKRTGLASVDVTNKIIRLLVKVTNISKLNTLSLYLGSSSFANFYLIPIYNPGDGKTLKEGGWSWIDFNFNASGSVITSGSPSKTNITDYQIRWTDDNTGTPVTIQFNGIGFVEELNPFPNGVVSIQFDDSLKTQYTNARPILDKYGFSASAMTIVDQIDYDDANHLTLSELHDLHDNHGWEVAAHAYTAANHATTYTGLSTPALDEDLRLMKQWLVSNGFGDGDYLAYPLGEYNTSVERVAAKYYSNARTVIPTPAQVLPTLNPYRLRSKSVSNTTTTAQIQTLIDNAYNNKNWLILTFHGIVTTPSLSTEFSIANFTTVVDYLYSKGIPVRTTGEVMRTATSNFSINPVTTSATQTLTNKTHTSPVINTGVSGTAIDTDGTLAANSDTKLASQKAVKTYADAKVSGPASSTDNAVARFDGTTGKLAQNSVVTIGDTGNITTTGTTITLNTKNIVSGSGNLTLTDFNSVQIASVRNDNGNLSTIGAVKVLEWSSNTSNPSARVTPTGASQKALVVKGLSSQTGNLQEWQDSSGTSLMSVSSAGVLTTASDIEITDTTKGVILKSPDGTRWRVKIDNTGTLTTTSI